MLGFLFRRSKRSSNNSLRKGRAVNALQKQLDGFQKPAQEKQMPPTWASSMRKMESEVNDELRDFQSRVKEIKETSLRLEELTKMLKSGEIPENAYTLILNELGGQLSISVEELFKLREDLEIAKAKAKLEWAKEKIGLKEFETLEHPGVLKEDIYLRRELYLPLYKWEEITSKIDVALSSLNIEEETSIIEQYLSLIKEKLPQKAESGEIERGIAMCRQRLTLISDRWASIRRSKIEQIMSLELKASQIKDEIKEIEARFTVGELDQSTYEYRMSALQVSLKASEKEITSIRNYIDDMDMKIFRCSELLREKP